jgi:hypothetical protein
VYHFELRKFPHSVSRFNQTEHQVLSLAVSWTSEQWVEVGERKWNVNESTLTVLEGPELSLQEMSMNRGWRNARRRSENVTERVLAAARAAGAAPAAASPPGQVAASDAAVGRAAGDADLELLADSLGLEILTALDTGPAPLARVWRLADDRLGGRPPAESIALAERAVRSLLARGLIVVRGDQGAGAGGGPGGSETAGVAAIERMLGSVDSWTASGDDAVLIARSA